MLIVGAIADGIYHQVFAYRREIYTLKDGGEVSIDWPSYPNKPENNDEETPIVICLHGISGNSKVNYMTHLTAKVLEKGWRQACFNARGCGGTDLTTPRGFNAEYTEDVREIVNYIHTEHPKAPLFCVGFSLGANILTKYLGEEGEKCPAIGAVTLCNPFNLDLATAHMDSSFVHREYNKRMAKNLVEYVTQHEKKFSQPSLRRQVSVENISKSKSLREFDTNYILPQFEEFSSVQDYYHKSSSIRYLGGVRIPMLCVQSLDDPFVPLSAWPTKDFIESTPNLILCGTYRGSHVSWIEGWNPFDRYAWSDRVITEFCASLLKHQEILKDR